MSNQYNDLLTYPNVVGAGLGKEHLIVMVERKLPEAALAEHEIIPKAHHGVITKVFETGVIKAPRPFTVEPQAHTDRMRPAPGGVSIGHYKITAGTLGCVVFDEITKKKVILSNNHVLANSNNAAEGDQILQPGPADGGQYQIDKIGSLLRFHHIHFSEDESTCPIADFTAKAFSKIAKLFGSSHKLVSRKVQQTTNKIDAALAMPVNDGSVSREILDISGTVTGTGRAIPGTKVRKSGRTTEYTENEVLIVGATVKVQYGGGRIAVFEDQFVCGPMSQGGDSGSLILDRNEMVALGLLFAGSEQVTICNNIHYVMSELNFTF